MKLITIALLALGFGLNAVAAEAPHPVALGNVTGLNGTPIELKMHDHTVAGGIKDFVMFGFVDEESFSSELTLRKDKQLIRTVFKEQADGRIGGVISRKVGDKDISSSYFMKKVDAKNNQIIFDINGVEAVATFVPESIANGHLINPTVSIQMGTETISYKMEGEGCFGYLVFNTMMIAASYSL